MNRGTDYYLNWVGQGSEANNKKKATQASKQATRRTTKILQEGRSGDRARNLPSHARQAKVLKKKKKKRRGGREIMQKSL